MLDWLHRPERIIAVAAALLLQAALYSVLSTRHTFQSSGMNALPLMAIIMTATRPRRAAPPPPSFSEPRIRNPVIDPAVVPPIISPARQRGGPTSSIDWQAAMRGVVTTELAHAAGRPKATFGFPQVPPKQAPPPAFGWDEAHINRVQRIEHGIIDVGPCTITLAFPIPICHFGKGSADGDLFEHMHERPMGEPH